MPGYLAGGPVQSINTLTKHLANDFNFKIISTDKDFKTSKPYDNIKSDEWNIFDKREVFYISQKNLNKKYILHLISSTHHDVIYLNSLYSQSINFTADIQPSSNFYIGIHAPGECFNGNISHVSVYNKALTTQEIQQNYNATKNRFGL